MQWPWSKPETRNNRSEPKMSKRSVTFSVGIAGKKTSQAGMQAQSTSDILKQLFPGSIGYSGHRTNQDAIYDNTLLRAVSRHLCRDVALAHRFKSLLLDNILTRKPEPPEFPADLPPNIADDIRREWIKWTKTATPFANSIHPFCQVERELLGSVIEDGEVLVTHTIKGGKLELEAYNADQFYEINSQSSAQENAYMGIITNKKGKPIAYLVYENTSPRYFLQGSELLKIPASMALHIYDPDSFGQYRGRPWITAALLRIAAVKEYDTYSSATMRILAKLAMFFVKKPGAVSTMSGREDEVEFSDDEDEETIRRKASDKQSNLNKVANAEEIAANAIVELPEGVEPLFPSPNIPAAHWDKHREALVKDGCAGVGIDYATLMCDHSQTNFSGARQGEINNRDKFMSWQEWWHFTYRLPIFQQWLANDYLRMRPGLRNSHFLLAMQATWTGKRWPWVDPLKDVKALIEQVGAGLISPQDAAKQMGKDWQKNITDLAAFKKKCDEDGVGEIFDKIMATKMPGNSKQMNEEAGEEGEDNKGGKNDA